MRNTRYTLVALVLAVAATSVEAQSRLPARQGQPGPQQNAGPPASSQPLGPAPAPRQSAAPSQPAPPKAPFVLTAAEEAALDQILTAWEQRSEKVRTFKCQFTRWDYDKQWGPERHNHLMAEGQGEVKFKAPDHGVFRVSAMKEYEKNEQRFVERKEGLDHWVCDGDSIFEFKTAAKQLVERKLPPQMRGKAISDGPLPFIFGAKAETLKHRYFLREITPRDVADKEIWLEAFPRYQSDAANFQRVTFILTRGEFLPFALQLYMPAGNNRTVYQFFDLKINDPLGFLLQDFAAPRTPFGWKRVLDDPNGAPPPTQRPVFQPAGNADQAQRPAATTQRK